jgi:hypothetical protein
MADSNNSIRGMGSRLVMSTGFILRTFLEVLEIIVLAMIIGAVAMHLIPVQPHMQESSSQFLSASALGLVGGVVYIAYRALLRALFRRPMVVPIPDNPNVDWYLTIRSFGIAGGGLILGIVLLFKGLGGDHGLRDGNAAPFVDAVSATIAVGSIYLGGMKLFGRFSRG